jgi:hypothetical protein
MFQWYHNVAKRWEKWRFGWYIDGTTYWEQNEQVSILIFAVDG